MPHDTEDALIRTPFGAVALSLCKEQLTITLLSKTPARERRSEHPMLSEVSGELVRYLQDPHIGFDTRLVQPGTAFQQRVWHAIEAIPCGQTLTYGELAQQLGSGARAVANACGANQLPLLIPCHRVVSKTGIGGFMQGAASGLSIKRWLLRHEAVKGCECE
ncbi:MAG: methylated-DNA--[protein]-cysteine S-methyltransferase [Betaproteobacteria bacterium]|nr:methylated-DNA--[protein]-cysteine S-methyltransferase [Betaproteobacteria bacterium]